MMRMARRSNRRTGSCGPAAGSTSEAHPGVRDTPPPRPSCMKATWCSAAARRASSGRGSAAKTISASIASIA
eukprot:1027562-Prymnesium_polylepis.1